MFRYNSIIFIILAYWFSFSSVSHAVSTPEEYHKFFPLTGQNRPFKACVLEKRSNNYNSAPTKCAVFEKYNAPVRCVIGVDRLDCLRKISMQMADFAIFDPQELLVASNHKNLNDILIVSEFQRFYSTINKFQYSLAVVVRNDANIKSINDLKDKNLCHPGTDPDGFDHSDLFSQFFEDRMVIQKCDPHRTVVENRIKSLSDYFTSSCRAGPWTLDPILDSALKLSYSSLCDLCEGPGLCENQDLYWGRRNSLLCLSDCRGDIAWGRVDEIQRHFKPTSQYGRLTTSRLCSNVSFLCPNGTLQDLSSENPCVWVQKPNTVVAAHSSVAKNVQNFIQRVLIDQTEGILYRSVLSTLLESPPRFKNVDLVTPKDYLMAAEGYLSTTSVNRCGKDRQIKLCAASKFDKAQCEWLSAAANSYGIEPPVMCYEPSDSNCYLAVQNGLADVFLTNSDQLLPALRDYNLKPILYETVSDKTYYKYYSILIDTKSNITKLADLRGKKACFTSVDGVGWTSFLLELKRASLLPNVCPHVAALSEFFGEICITSPVNSTITTKYKNIRYCNNEITDDYYRQSGIEREAVDCILYGGADFAFIAVDSVSHYGDSNYFILPKPVKEIIGDKFKWLCHDNKIQEKPCLLTWTTVGQVLVHQNISYIRKEDIIAAFKNLDSLFGGSKKKGGKHTFTFDLFSEFETSSKVLFQDLGDRLELTDIYLAKHQFESSSYENQIRSVLVCETSLTSSSWRITSIKEPILTFCFSFTVFYNKIMNFLYL